MGAVIRGDVNLIVMNYNTGKETGDPAKFRAKAVHEVTHLYLYHAAWKHNQTENQFIFPAWMDEGISTWTAHRYLISRFGSSCMKERNEKILDGLTRKGINIPLSAMNEDLCLLDDPNKYRYGPRAQYGYARSFLAIYALVEKMGEDSFFQKIHRVAENMEGEYGNGITDQCNNFGNIFKPFNCL